MRRLGLAALIVLTSCGSEATSAPSATIAPVTNAPATAAPATIAPARRIIPVDGDLAEIVFALGLGDEVVATDLSATYPPAADALPEIGYQRALTAETILSYDPTLVLATDLAGPPEVIDQLRDTGVTVVVIERGDTIDGPANKIRAVADALGVSEAGEQLAAATQTEIDDAMAVGATSLNDREHGPPLVAMLYLRGDNAQLIFGPGSNSTMLIEAAGARDLGRALGIGESTPITTESFIESAPDVIVVTTTGLESVGGIEGLLAIPGIAQTPAGQHRAVLAYEDQLLLGGGPRTGRMLAQLVVDLNAVP